MVLPEHTQSLNRVIEIVDYHFLFGVVQHPACELNQPFCFGVALA